MKEVKIAKVVRKENRMGGVVKLVASRNYREREVCEDAVLWEPVFRVRQQGPHGLHSEPAGVVGRQYPLLPAFLRPLFGSPKSSTTCGRIGFNPVGPASVHH